MRKDDIERVRDSFNRIIDLCVERQYDPETYAFCRWIVLEAEAGLDICERMLVTKKASNLNVTGY